jgi:hypothetical protein
MCSETEELIMALETAVEQALVSGPELQHEWLLWMRKKISEHVKEAEVES